MQEYKLHWEERSDAYLKGKICLFLKTDFGDFHVGSVEKTPKATLEERKKHLEDMADRVMEHTVSLVKYNISLSKVEK
jgi:hypothetical protein